MKRTIALLLSMLLLFALTACEERLQESSETSKPEQTQELKEEIESTYIVSAGGLELKYPEKWRNKVTVAVGDNRVCFSCGDAKLFDLVFNREEGSVFGTVRGEEYTVIYAVDYPIEKDNDDLCRMQSDINVILDNLIADYDFVPGAALEKEDSSTIDIETSVVTLEYPAKWKGKVQIDISEDLVSFSNDGTPLFDLVFSECEGYLLGTYKDTPIYFVEFPVNDDEQTAMIDDVNVIFEHLSDDPNFVINTN